MDEIICVLGKRIKFTRERFTHIIVRHPELEGKEDDIIKTLTSADFVQESIYDKNVLLYYRGIGRKRYFVTVVKVLNNHGFSSVETLGEKPREGYCVPSQYP